MTKKTKILLLAVLTILVNLGIDQLTKKYAIDVVKEYRQNNGVIQVVGNFLTFRYAENDGAFLSMGSGLEQPWKMIFLLLFPVILVIVSTLYLFMSKKLTTGQIFALACVVGGGVSNVIDRLVNEGAVVDFIHFNFYIFRTGILNVADMSITFGAIVFMILEYRKEKREKAEKQAALDQEIE